MGIGHLREHLLGAAFEQVRGQLRLLLDQGVDLLLDRPPADKLVHQHVAPLANAESAVGGLVLDGRVPPAVEMDHVRGGGQVQANAAGLQRQHEEGGAAVALELVDELLPSSDRRAPVQDQPGAAEYRREEPRQRLGHFPKLGEDQRLLLARRDLLADLPQPRELAALVGLEKPVAQQLAGVVAQLLEAHQVGQHQAAALHAVEVLEQPGHFLDQPGVQRGLPARQPAIRSYFRLVRQIGNDALVGFHAPEDVRLHQAAKRRVAVLLARLEPLDELLELLLRTEQARAEEIKQGPKVGQPVLDRGAGEHDSRSGPEPLDGPGLPRRRILDGLRLVEHDQLPVDLRQPRLAQEHPVGRHDDVGALEGLGRVGGRPVEPVLRGLGRMDELGAERRGEPVHLRFPVPQQGSRQNQQRWPGAAVLLQNRQKRQHLDRLAQPHVVGQAGAEPQVRHEPEPVEARLLILAQDRLQVAARPGPVQALGASQTGEHLAEPVARVDERPLALAVAVVVVGQVPGGPGQQAHPFDEREPVPGLLFDLLPVVQGFGQLVAVDFDPLAPQQHEPFLGGQQLAPFGFGKLLFAQGELHLEVEHRLGIELLLSLLADGNAHPGTGTLFPPVGQAHQHAAFLEDRHLLEEPVRLAGRPRQRLVDVARVDQLPGKRALLRGPVDGREQLHQRLLVLLPGDLAQRPAERLILHPGAAGEAWCVGGQEGKGIVRVAAVLGQMEADPAHLVPERGPLLQEAQQALPATRDLAARPGVQVFPGVLQGAAGQVLGALHRRNAQQQGGQLRR